MICEWCRESYGLVDVAPAAKHEVNECRAILKAKFDATREDRDHWKAQANDLMKKYIELHESQERRTK